ncbi:DUF2142 domain-containing protein [Cryobacterium mannosilyticum]|uniref:DUF2142 domain-containing protein n=1 Tax=Cryobacterium mannosilyticum TaxID=1259190 RepID=UPI00141BC703|nr:DUF2142 domain-containing protein [Cryobacterium mannosilyticum]
MTLLVSWGAIFLLSAAWAITSPLGASPDEPAHIIKAAAVARGQLIGELTDAPAVTQVMIPKGLSQAGSWPCYAFDNSVEANCTPAISNVPRLAAANTSAGLYNPTYYALVGLPSVLTNDTSLAVMTMRLTSALIASLFLATSFCALLRLGNPFITGLGFLSALTPMVFFLNGAVNPNSLEIATGAALLTSLLVLVRGSTQHERLWLVVVATSGILMAQARGLSPLWMAVIAASVLVFASTARLKALLTRWDVWVTLVLLGAGVAAAGAWILRTGTLQSMGVFPGAGSVGPVEAFVEMLVARSFDQGTVGVFGWLDTPAPSFAFALWSALGIGSVVLALAVARGRRLGSITVALAGFMLIPPIVQAASVKASGYIWQGRYALVGYVVLVLIASIAVASDGETPRQQGLAVRGRIVIIIGGLVSIGQVFALATALKRYGVGADSSWLDALRQTPLWSPPGGGLVWLTVSLCAMVVIVVLWGISSRGAAASRPPSAPVSVTSSNPKSESLT